MAQLSSYPIVDDALLTMVLGGRPSTNTHSSPLPLNWSQRSGANSPVANTTNNKMAQKSNSNYYMSPKMVHNKNNQTTPIPPLPLASSFLDVSSPGAWKSRVVVPSSSLENPSTPKSLGGALPNRSLSEISSVGSSTLDSPSKRNAEIESELTKQNLYKSELCRNWMETGNCRYGVRCQFAHGGSEVRNIMRHPKYKTEICRTFHTTGTCSYGKRCRFVHHASEMRSQESLRAEETFAHQLSQLKLENTSLPVSSSPIAPSSSSNPGTPNTRSGFNHNNSSQQRGSFSPPPSPYKSPSSSSRNVTAPIPYPSNISEISAGQTQNNTEHVPEVGTPSKMPNTSPSTCGIVPFNDFDSLDSSTSDSCGDDDNSSFHEDQISPALSNFFPDEDSDSATGEDYESSLKKNSSYRLPFFAKLHSWKKK